VSALDLFLHGQLPGHVQTASGDRLTELEARVQDLERLVAALLSEQEAPKPKRLGKARERTTGLLPRPFVSLLTFARLHNVAEAKVQTHVDLGLLPVKQGEWTETDGEVVTLAFDAQGRAAFYQLYHEASPFVECNQCPHGYLDTTVQTERSDGFLTRKSPNIG
jgi:hypothetical protein